jgi:hypothetical protein
VNIRRLLFTIGGATSLMLAVSVPAALASPQAHPDLAAEASSAPVPAPYPGAVPVLNSSTGAVILGSVNVTHDRGCLSFTGLMTHPYSNYGKRLSV